MEDIAKVANDLTLSNIVIPFSFWNTMDLATRTLFDLLLLFIVVGIIGSGRWLFLVTPTVTLLVPPVHAVEFSLNPLDYMPNPMDLLTASGLSHLFTIFKLAILIIGVVVVLMRNLFYKVQLSYHTGLTNTSTASSRFYLEISFVVIHKQFGRTFKSLVTIRTPIVQAFPAETVAVLTLKETNVYYLSQYGLMLAEPLTIRGLYSEGTYSSTGDLRIRIPWTDLSWEKNHPPVTVSSGSNGAALGVRQGYS